MRFIFYTYSDTGTPLITTTVILKRKTATSDTRFVTQLKSSVKTTA